MRDIEIAVPNPSATREAQAPDEPLLVVDGLRTVFDLRHGVVKAVDGVSFALRPRETLAIVGESGCGKSITALSLMRLVPDPPGRIAGGTVSLGGVDLLSLSAEAMRSVRGKDIAMIFQEPMTSLNPVLTIGSQIAEVLLLHEDIGRHACLGQGGRHAAARAHPGARAARQGISASAFRRHAPARHDRHGLGLQSEGADRG